MKSQLVAIIAAVVLVGCVGVSKTELLKDEEGNLIILPVEPVPEAATPEPPTAKAPDILIHIAAMQGNLEAVKQHIAAGADVNAKDRAGKTPLDWAEGETADLLRKHGGKTGEEFAEKFKGYFVGTIKIRFHQAELSEDRKRVPWTGYGVDGGFPRTVVTAVEITNASGTYSLPANMVNDLGDPNIGHVHVRQNGKLLELSMNNSDGAGGHNALFKVDLAKALACRFVKVAIDDDHTKTHDWTALKKRK